MSKDEGETWKRLAENVIEKPVNAILVSECHGNLDYLIVSGEGCWYSHDLRITWAKLIINAEVAGHQVSAVIAPNGLCVDEILLCGFADSRIAMVRIETEGFPDL